MRGVIKHLHADAGGATLSLVGLSVMPGLNGVQANADDADGAFVQFSSSGAPNSVAGILAAADPTRGDWGFAVTFRVKTGLVGQTRNWIGLFASDPSGSNTPAIEYAGFRYSVTADGTAFWRAVTDNASGIPTVTVTTQSIASNTVYEFTIRYDATSPSILFYINGTLVATHTTTLPLSTTPLHYAALTTALGAVIRTMRVDWMSLSHE